MAKRHVRIRERKATQCQALEQQWYHQSHHPNNSAAPHEEQYSHVLILNPVQQMKLYFSHTQDQLNQ